MPTTQGRKLSKAVCNFNGFYEYKEAAKDGVSYATNLWEAVKRVLARMLEATEFPRLLYRVKMYPRINAEALPLISL